MKTGSRIGSSAGAEMGSFPLLVDCDSASTKFEGHMDQRLEIKRLKDYRASAFSIDRAELEFDLNLTATRVRARLHMKRRGSGKEPLILSGEELALDEVRLNGGLLAPD